MSIRVAFAVLVVLAGTGIARAQADLDAGSVDAMPIDAGLPESVDARVIADAPPATHSEAPAAPPTPPTAETTAESTFFAIKVIGGLIALLVLAYLGAHRRVVRFQERLGISGVITA